MEWGDLRYVVALADEGSMVAAARALGVEHTTVSRRIAALERDLGVRLFIRTPDGQCPTSSGEAAIATGRALQRSILELESAIAGTDARPSGTVRLTTSEGFVQVVVPHLPRFYSEHAEIKIELLTGNRVFDLNRNEVDIAIRLVSTERDDLVVRHVSRIGWALYASPSYFGGKSAEVPAKWEGHRVIHFEEALRGTPGQRWLMEHAQGAIVALRGNSIPSCAAGAAAGLGIACLPCLHGDRDARLQRLGAPVTNGDLWLAARPDRLRIVRNRVVWDFLLELASLERELLTGIS
ncbi:MAG: LysR family transcriptional regulator [Proteobacteria bacterium]|nr:LysR family transcriptional regulator [Pseudomonadota bacterium]